MKFGTAIYITDLKPAFYSDVEQELITKEVSRAYLASINQLLRRVVGFFHEVTL